MNTRSFNISKALLLAFAVAVGITVLIQVSRSSPALASQVSTKTTMQPAPSAHNGTALVTVFLKANSFSARLPKRAIDLLATTKGSTAARLAAQRNPYARSDSESVAASIAENARNAALPLIRKAARPDVDASSAVQRTIHRLGGTIISANPIPNQIVARLTTSSIDKLRSDPRVDWITGAKLPIEMAAPIDGSSTWWTNGFTGQGTSADGNGSPDAVVFDTGTRVTHDAFKTRMPGDCATCLGSGPSRIISPLVRTDFLGSKHGNTIGATIAATSFSAGPTPSAGVGIAYGIDKLYDNYDSYNPFLWDLGIATPRPSNYPTSDPASDPGLAGGSDLPETINYSAGIYTDNQDLYTGTMYWDSLEANFGILNTISAGNCGIQTASQNGCSDGPHRVSAPGTNYNVVTMGGLDVSANPSNIATYAPWPNTSPGPTWGGRKKPDLIGPVFGTAGTPSAIDDHATASFGDGTSFAAPVASAGALLLASSGVYLPTAQKAIIINSATPVQGQTYWTPRTGWGAINMSNAYYARGNYANGNVSGTGPNSARFYKLTGVANGDRATLVWNRRTTTDSTLAPTYYALTNFDLSQFDPNTLATTSTGGSDATDTVDTDQTITTANPMPGNGTDGGDNVEQIRSTATGTQILKVKSLSSIDGSSSEPFSVAAQHPVTALTTPVPQVTLEVLPTFIGGAYQAQVTATVTNPSDDLDLDNVSVELGLPGGVLLPSGSLTSPPVSVAAGDSTTATWIVQGGTSGTKTLSATATGTTYGESFSGSDTTTLDVDMTPPVVAITTPPAYSATATPSFQWGGNDSQSDIDHFDVETSGDSAAFASLPTTPLQTSASIPPAAEGQTVYLRVRATDLFGNVSNWTEVSTTIDVIPPVASVGTLDKTKRGTLRAQLLFSNVGSPLTATFSFANNYGGRLGTATNGQFVSYVNTSPKIVYATLRLVVKDALGREASATETYPVESALSASGLKFSSVKKSGGGIAVAGKVAKDYTGKVTVTARRVGAKGTKKVTKRVTAKNGKFAARLAVKPGRYRVVASTSKTSVFTANSVSKKLAIK